MASVCEFCRELVVTSAGFFVNHGVSSHGKYELCAGSGLPICQGCSV